MLIFVPEKCPTKSHCLFTQKLNVELLNPQKYRANCMVRLITWYFTFTFNLNLYDIIKNK